MHLRLKRLPREKPEKQSCARVIWKTYEFQPGRAQVDPSKVNTVPEAIRPWCFRRAAANCTRDRVSYPGMSIQRYLVSLCILVVFVASCTEPSKRVISQRDAIRIARDYVHEKTPQLELFGGSAQYVQDGYPAFSGSMWIVSFAYPSPKDPATGKTPGMRPFISLGVWVRPNGSVEGTFSHTP